MGTGNMGSRERRLRKIGETPLEQKIFRGPQYNRVILDEINVPGFSGEEEVEEVAKKPVIRRGAQPKRQIKKPKCVVHKEEMNFDAVAQKWICPVVTCSMVARPKRADNEITIGKGRITLRVVYLPKQEPSLVLISDDNIALDITNLVSRHVRDAVKIAVRVSAEKLRQSGTSNGHANGSAVRVTMNMDSVFLVNILDGKVPEPEVLAKARVDDEEEDSDEYGEV